MIDRLRLDKAQGSGDPYDEANQTGAAPEDAGDFLGSTRRFGDTLSSMALPDEAEEAIPEPTFNFPSIDERIKWLARTQKVNGSWDDDLEMTAAALLAFVRAGHTTLGGSYRQQVRKAAIWLQTALPQANQGSGFPMFAAARALRELAGATGDPLTISNQLPVPSTDQERATTDHPVVSVPSSITTLDDLRVAALMVGNVEPNAPIKQAGQQKLIQVWLALGKPLL